MTCVHCLGVGGFHHPSCPNYIQPNFRNYCKICKEPIFYGETYIKNMSDEYIHEDCAETTKELVEFLDGEIGEYEEDNVDYGD